MTCASTLARSDFKVRREGGFLTIVSLSHAENVASRTPQGVADYNEAAGEQAVTNNPALSVVLARVLDLDRSAVENDGRIFEVQTPICERSRSLLRIEGDAHKLL